MGGDGAVHQGFCDIALLAVLPQAALVAPIDESSLRECMLFMNDYDEGLSAVRYPRDNVSLLAEERFGPAPAFQLGKARPLIQHENPNVAVLAYGTCAIQAIQAADELSDQYRTEVYDARFAKPVDEELLERLISAGTPIITIEDHGLPGGFGSQVIEACNRRGLDASMITRLGMPERWILQGSREEQLAEIGIDSLGIQRAIRHAVDRNQSSSIRKTSPAGVGANSPA